MSESQTPEKCPRCQSPDPARHPAVQSGGEVQICPDRWHSATSKSARPEGAMVMVPRGAVQRLILAADCYGVKHLDSDDMSDEAVELQDATEAMKDLIAATQQSPISGEGWQDISTAPKDGRIVLIIVGTELPRAVAAAWNGGEHWPWTTFDGSETSDGFRARSATHWRPLPAPPVPSVSGPEDHSPSLRDTHPGSADASSSNEGAGS